MENCENVSRCHRLSWGIVMIVIGGVLCLQFAGLLPIVSTNCFSAGNRYFWLSAWPNSFKVNYAIV